MTSITITVDNKQNALLLQKLLQKMPFVKKIESDLLLGKSDDQFDRLEEILNSIEPGTLFSEIIDPISWQKSARNEWEAR